MADFMTVLAASQKPAPNAAHGKALAGLLPEGLFENVLTAQLGVAADRPELLPALSTALPQTFSEQISLADKTLARKSPQIAGAGMEPVTESALMPPAFAGPVDRDRPAIETSEEGEIRATPHVTREVRTKAVADMAATPAVAAAGQRQELPLTQQVQGGATGQAGTQPEDSAELSPLLAATAAPTESARSPDASTLAATRQLGQIDHAARAADAPVRTTVETPVRSQGFPAEFSEKIVWLVGRQSQVADLSLNPPQLGSLEVRLSLSGGEAGAQFYSPHPLVRDAIEAALPKLRELMAQAGITLGDAQVRDEAFSRGEAGGNAARSGFGGAGDEVATSLAPVAAGAVRTGQGLIDLYA